VYGLETLFEAIAEHDLAAPASAAGLRAYLDEHLYVEGDILFTPHAIQVLTDDDDIMMAYYFFDDHFLAKHSARAAYLLHDDWKLPPCPAGPSQRTYRAPRGAAGALAPRGKGQGNTYAVFLAAYASDNLDFLHNSFRLPGVRLPDLARYLART